MTDYRLSVEPILCILSIPVNSSGPLCLRKGPWHRRHGWQVGHGFQPRCSAAARVSDIVCFFTRLQPAR